MSILIQQHCFLQQTQFLGVNPYCCAIKINFCGDEHCGLGLSTPSCLRLLQVSEHLMGLHGTLD